MHIAHALERGVKMTVLTIRGIDDEVGSALRAEAKKRGTSMNSLVLELLGRGLGIAPGRVTHHDLDAMAGAWTAEQHAAFTAAVSDFERIDEGLWE
jgi:plasmid stability protein